MTASAQGPAAATAPERLAVETLHLAMFRSYARAELDTGGASVVLFGANGAGKTNLLEAVSLLVPGRGLRRAPLEELARRVGDAGDTGGAGGPRGWRIKARVRGTAGPAELVTGAEASAPGRRRVEIDGKAAPQAALGRIMRMVWLTPAMDRMWTGPAAERRRFLDRMVLGFAPEHGEAVLAYEKAMRERNRLLAEPAPDRAWLAALEARMAATGAAIACSRALALNRLRAALNRPPGGPKSLFPRVEITILGKMESRFTKALEQGVDADSLTGEEAERLSRALAAARPRDAAAGRALEGPHRSDLAALYAAKGMPAAACSTGEQKALLLSLVLANVRALAGATGAAPVVLLDEVAAHLDEARRAALFEEMAALGAQAWMTGTDAGLFEAVGPEALRLRVREENGVSRLEQA